MQLLTWLAVQPGGWDRRQPGAVIAGDDAQAPLTEYHLGCQGSDLSIQYQV